MLENKKVFLREITATLLTTPFIKKSLSQISLVNSLIK